MDTYRGHPIHVSDPPASSRAYDSESQTYVTKQWSSPILPGAGWTRTRQELLECIDILIHCGADKYPPEGAKREVKQAYQDAVYEYYAIVQELKFRRAYAAQKYLPRERMFMTVDITIVGMPCNVLGRTNNEDTMVSCPALNAKLKQPSTFSVPRERYPKRARPFIRKGAVFQCVMRLDQDNMFGMIRLRGEK